MPNIESETIFVSDIKTSRETIVFDALREVGAAAERALHAPKQILRSAVFAIGLSQDISAETVELQMIEELRHRGHAVIAYADGAEAWPLNWKCRPLLAGALRLLDSSKPSFKAEFVRIVSRAVESTNNGNRERIQLHNLMKQFGIVGEGVAITETFRRTVQFSEETDVPVLILGESGTGKELIARSLARMDPKRKNGPFVAVNCAALPPNMVESEVFGHRRGAFTGAERERRGWIRSADGGTLFLDEIGEMELGLQAKLLRTLQDHRVRSLGDDHEVSVNARFLAATSRNLEEMVKQGKFRGDLFNRLAVLKVEMPSLGQRTEDIRILVEHFIQKHGTRRPPFISEVNPDFIAALETLKFAGNIRELENLVQRSIVNRQRQEELCLHDLPMDVLAQLAVHRDAVEVPQNTTVTLQEVDHVREIASAHGWNLQVTVREFERIVCCEALKFAHGNQAEAARLLGVTSRSIYNKVHRLGK